MQGEADGKVRVHAKYSDGTAYTDEFDTVIFAVGRDAETAKLGLDKVSTRPVLLPNHNFGNNPKINFIKALTLKF